MHGPSDTETVKVVDHGPRPAITAQEFALDFLDEGCLDLDYPYEAGRWQWTDIDVGLMIRNWFGGMPAETRIPIMTWWQRCRREDGSSDALLRDLQEGRPLRTPVLLSVGGYQNPYFADRIEIHDGCHRIVACAIAGVPRIKAAIGVFPSAADALCDRLGLKRIDHGQDAAPAFPATG